MNTRPDPLTSTTTFVIRFWIEYSQTGVHWRGSVEHIPSGERAVFQRVEDLLQFWSKFDILLINDFSHK